MTQASELLSQILVRIEQAGPKSLVVFDLDSTLFDVSSRSQQILRDFAGLPETRQKYPQSIEILEKLQIHPREWGIQKPLVEAGLGSLSPDFDQAIHAYWTLHFFSGEYLQFDSALPGAAEFTKRIEATGARLVYLTGRDFSKMFQASKEILQKQGFANGELVLKSDTSQSDESFKVDWFSEQNLASYDPIYFFENEPHNIHAVCEKHPSVQIVFIDSTHSGKSRVSKDWPSLVNFSLPLLSERTRR